MSAPRGAGSADALLASARAALQRGDVPTAEALCRQVLAKNDRNAAAWTVLGTALRHRDPVAAEKALRKAIESYRSNPDALFHLANLLRSDGRHAQSIPLYRRILERTQAHPSVSNNLGLALAADGQHAEAEAVFRQVLTRDPAHPQALANLAHLLCQTRRYAEVVPIANHYVQRHGNVPAALWIDLGVSQHALRDYDAAVRSFRQALASSPHDPIALLDLGAVLSDMGDFEAAEAVLSEACAAAPQNVHALALLAYCRQHLCAWHELPELQASVVGKLRERSDNRVSPFVLLSMPSSPQLQRDVATRWAAGIEPARTHGPASIRQRGTRLRLGYLSSDLRSHAIAFLATEVWERHDRNRITTFAYALPPPDSSALRARIVRAFDTFHDCSDATSEQIVQRIRADGVDLLIDLNGYTTHSRSEIVAARAAPRQAQWLGYLGTMGAPWMDYILTDRFVTPPASTAFYTERALYLPECYCPTDTRRVVATAFPARAECGLPEHGTVLCCFNNPYKLLPATFDVWMRVLQRAPDAVLWLSPSSDVAASNLRREAQACGIAPERLIFAPRVTVDVHLARHAHADLYLDTLPYNAGTAANDALFMGVPVLTCSGETMASRAAGSQLHAIGLHDCVTEDLAAYEARAIELATDRDARREMRERLRANRDTHALFDMERFTAALDDILIAAAI